MNDGKALRMVAAGLVLLAAAVCLLAAALTKDDNVMQPVAGLAAALLGLVGLYAFITGGGLEKPR